MATAITPLANITLSSSASTVTFSSISGSYRDLLLVWTGTNPSTLATQFRFNSDSGNNYSTVVAWGDGSTPNTNVYSNVSANYAQFYGVAYSNRGMFICQIMDYSATDKHKTALIRHSSASSVVEMLSTRWANTAAITSLSFGFNSNQFAAGSTFALYGVSA